MHNTIRSPVRDVAALAVAGLLVGCTTAPPPSPSTVLGASESASVASPGPSASTATTVGRDAQLQQLIDGWAADNDPVGVVAGVLFPDGELWLGGAGMADRERGIPVVPTGRFEVASITKTFMSALTLMLAEDGAVDLDAPIASLLPAYPASDRITMRMLLGHRAGVFDPSSQLVTDQFGPPDPNRVFSAAELVEATVAETPVFEPGSTHEYSNAGYWVLAACLEAATGEGISSLIAERLTGPLQLANTVLFDETLPDVEVVNAYSDLDLDGTEDPMGTQPLAGYVTPAWAAGGMISTAEDLVHFLGALFRGELLSEDSLAQMLDTTSGGGSYGLGIYRAGAGWGHDGGIKGYLSAAFHDPDMGVTVVVLTNRFGPDAPQADALAPALAALADGLAAGE